MGRVVFLQQKGSKGTLKHHYRLLSLRTHPFPVVEPPWSTTLLHLL